MIQQLQTMLTLQAALEDAIDPTWLSKDHPYNRAAWKEASELMDWNGWKWWKAHEVDLFQAKMELVDIWHFILAQNIINVTEPWLLRNVETMYTHSDENTQPPVLDMIEDFIRHCLMDDTIPVYQFFALCHQFELSWDELFNIYLGKNILNTFRTNNGYKDGTYIKAWGDNGEEDNVFLENLLSTSDHILPALLPQVLENALAAKYEMVKSAAQAEQV